MYSFAIFLLLAIEYRIFIFGQHLLLPRHFLVPSLDGLDGPGTVSLEGSRHGVDDLINGS